MSESKSITQFFGENLAEIIGKKILSVKKDFKFQEYYNLIKEKCHDLSYTQRIKLHAEILHQLLPHYPEAIKILLSILGKENPNETGMFKEYYRIMPIGNFIERYGLDDFDISMKAIEEITKRNTGEYAIRPFLRKYPKQTITIMQGWAKSSNFHLRRLASEGCRPKLPRATKLDEFVNNPLPVFTILELLIQDETKFVQKSVANNIADYLKVNYPAAIEFIEMFHHSKNKNTQRILKHAIRNIKI